MASLNTALGGLQAHQSWLDVIGNNIANANTPGFKSSRALFADLFSSTVKNATSPTSSLGGTNPVQVGLGVQLGQVDKNLAQGALQFTGRTFDLAILGQGFFSVSDGSQQYYTRVGTFGLDANSQLVDVRTGYKVLSDAAQAFTIDTGAVVPSEASSSISFEGNLAAEVTGPLAEVVTSGGEILEGTSASLSGSVAGPFAIPAGQTFTMDIAINGGSTETVSVTSTTGSVTAGEIANAINAVIDDATASVEPTGEVTITSDQAGADVNIKVSPGQPGLDLASTIGMSTSLVSGTEFAAAGASDLNDLVGNVNDYTAGESIELSGTKADGSQVAGTFTYGADGTTVDDLVAFINGLYTDATWSFDATTGKITGTANESGESGLSLVIDDGNAQVGKSNWALNALSVEINGAGPDTVTTSSEIFDAAGTSHMLTYSYERQDDGTWTMTVSSADSDVQLFNETTAGITFAADGTLVTPPTASFEAQFPGQGLQTIDIDFGKVGEFDGLTQFGDKPSVIQSAADGYAAGELGSIAVNADGSVDGVYTNGQVLSLGQLGIATFSNAAGLKDEGNGYFVATGNSGTPSFAAGGIAGAGEIVSGSLEQSNVDPSEQFVRLIEAQRGFQANARVISTINDLLAEVVNII